MARKGSKRQDASMDFENMSRKTGGRVQSVRGKSRKLPAPQPRGYGKARGTRQSGGNVP